LEKVSLSFWSLSEGKSVDVIQIDKADQPEVAPETA
jgi:hypothetical protein